MNTHYKKHFLSNSFFLSLITFIWPFYLFFLTILIANFLGSRALGEYSIVSNYYSLFVNIAIMGLNVLLVRELSVRDDGNSYFINAVYLGMLSSLISMAAVCFLGVIMGYSSHIKMLLFIFSLGIVFDVLILYCQSAYLSLNKIHIFFYIFFTSLIILTALLTFLIIKKVDLSVIGLAIAAIKAGTAFASLFFLHSDRFSLSPALFNFHTFKSIIFLLPIFSILSIIEIVILRIDIALLSKILNEMDVAVYSIAKRFIFFVFLLALNLAIGASPLLAKKLAEEPGLFYHLEERITAVLLALSAFININLWIFAKPIIFLFFGKEYVQSVDMLRILSLSCVPIFLSTYFSKLLIIVNHQKKDLYALFLCLLLSPVLYLFLCLKYGLHGCGYAFLFMSFLLFILRSFFIWRSDPLIIKKLRPLTAKFFFSVLFYGLTLFIVRNMSLPLQWTVVHVVFLGSLFLLQIMKIKDVDILIHILKKKISS